MLRTFASIGLIALSSLAAQAQAWPDRPVKIIVPYAADGGTDVLARVLADRLGDAFGQRFIVENRPGAGGMIGAEIVTRSASDGYSLLVSSPAEIAINQEDQLRPAEGAGAYHAACLDTARDHGSPGSEGHITV